MTANAPFLEKSTVGYSPVATYRKPYVSFCDSSTGAGSFVIDAFALSFLNLRSMLVDSDEPSLGFPFSATLRFGKSDQVESGLTQLLPNVPGVVVYDASQIFGCESWQSTPIVISERTRRAPQWTVSDISPILGAASRERFAENAPPLVEMALPHALTTSYQILLKEIHASGIWSWRKLEPILGPSHTDLQRIARGKVVSPQVGYKIDALHRFLRGLLGVTQGHELAIARALSTPRETDGMTASDHLVKGDFRKAFSAVMDVVSPRPSVADVQAVPLRWYDQPSRAIHDADREEHSGG